MVDLFRFGIPREFAEREWDDILSVGVLDESELSRYHRLYSVARKWVQAIREGKKKFGLFLYGSNGCGKSTLGCLILKELIGNGVLGDRVTMARLQKEFYENWHIPDMGLSKDVLFVEEVGKEYKTKQEHSEIMLEYILKYRSEHMLPTILSANADMESLVKRYGKTFESVVKGRFIPLNFPEVDLRLRLAPGEVKTFLGGQ